MSRTVVLKAGEYLAKAGLRYGPCNNPECHMGLLCGNAARGVACDDARKRLQAVVMKEVYRHARAEARRRRGLAGGTRGR